MKNFRAADKSHAGGDEKHDINFHWPYTSLLFVCPKSCASVHVLPPAGQPRKGWIAHMLNRSA